MGIDVDTLAYGPSKILPILTNVMVARNKYYCNNIYCKVT